MPGSSQLTSDPRPPLEVIFFDAAGTLFRVRETVGTTYWREAADSSPGNPALSPEELDEAFSQVFLERQPLVFPEARQQELPELERQWWYEVVRETFRRTGLPPPGPKVFQRIYGSYASAAAWRLESGCRKVLRELRSRGYRLGVISNFDSRLAGILEGLNIHGEFDSITVSSLARSAKPDPEIFLEALRAASTQAARALHVGDSLRDDVRGAAAVGMRSVWYAPAEKLRVTGVRTVRRLNELLRFLV